MRRPPASSRAAAAAVSHGLVELELVAERASALGRAGDRLEGAIEDWRLLDEVGEATPDQLADAMTEVTAAAYALIVQRDCAGFRMDNLAWIRRHYDIPEAALRRI